MVLSCRNAYVYIPSPAACTLLLVGGSIQHWFLVSPKACLRYPAAAPHAVVRGRGLFLGFVGFFGLFLLEPVQLLTTHAESFSLTVYS